MTILHHPRNVSTCVCMCVCPSVIGYHNSGHVKAVLVALWSPGTTMTMTWLNICGHYDIFVVVTIRISGGMQLSNVSHCNFIIAIKLFYLEGKGLHNVC